MSKEHAELGKEVNLHIFSSTILIGHLTAAKISQNHPITENRVPSLLAGAREGDLIKVDSLVRLQGVPVDAQEYDVSFAFPLAFRIRILTLTHCLIICFFTEYSNCSHVCGRFWKC